MTDISAHTLGVWIVQEEDGQIAANTPGGITYTNLVEGDSYIYLNTILKFDHRLYSSREGEDYYGGWKTIQIDDYGGIEARVYGGIRSIFTIMALVTEDIGEKLKHLYKLHVVAGDGNKYLVHQRAATTFEQFPILNSTSALKRYAEIIIRSMNFTETNDGGKDKKIAIIILEQVIQRR